MYTHQIHLHLCKIRFLYFHKRIVDTNVGWIYIGILTTNVHKIKIKQVKLLLKLEPKFCRKLKYMCTKCNAFTLLQSIVTSLREKWTSTSDSNFQTSSEIWGQTIKYCQNNNWHRFLIIKMQIYLKINWHKFFIYIFSKLKINLPECFSPNKQSKLCRVRID